ncbi:MULTISPECIES: protein-disulfide reductase DsbD [Pseudomonas]|uniref:Thiol:disulfide interchange protein DsbD n=1 Tax=Pseudomonas juntendi TaxID=2666183 RepID=A0A7W2LIL5_9PSED|nr:MULTISPECIES: protein-disulfide reductase DsbD [Pseudomonas]OAK64233.1 thiol:disulfide interchange protein [Pseudomonas putida]PPB16089.1 protein-disulfide reductase DsbD [Pseudomonas aeruginosa]MBA6141571.1 protein-disulfide reductase DsbD [Pseudomonas juntendi]MCL8327890.1 protein-disulfide reductase DsbD [Pseudomonas juntendi]QEQ87492.1 protein-disulfide reductase DsbD [Pseudomonas putida]
MRVLLLFLTLLLAGPLQANPFDVKPDFLPVEQAFVLTHDRQADGQMRLYFQIKPGYYLYQKRLKFDGLPSDQQPQLPPALNHHDEFFGDSAVYRDQLELLLPANAQGQLRLGWQGCADAGLCYPPQTTTIDLGGSVAPAAEQASDQALASGLQQGHLGWSLLAFFGLGLLLAFTPCSLPMLPILAGLVLGNGASARRGWLLAGVYVLSMALVYAALGVVAALLGASLQAWLQQPWLLGSLAGLFIILALPMFGAFELQLPAALRDRLDRAGRGTRGGNLYGAALLGALSGLLLGPCMTAPLAGALLYIAQSGDVLQGALVLFALGLGMGMPLLLLVTLGNRYLPRPGAWMDRVKAVFGFVFLAMALYTVRSLLPASLLLALAGAWLVALAWAAWPALQRLPALRAVPLLGALWGGLLLVGAAAGGDDLWQPLRPFAGGAAAPATAAHAEDSFVTVSRPEDLQRELDAAKSRGQWVMLDYYADWCVSCKVMEKQVFSRSDVQAGLAGVHLLRLDVTANSPASKALLQRYQVPGPPSIIWIGPEGEERRARRITGEVDAAVFQQHWAQTRSQG